MRSFFFSRRSDVGVCIQHIFFWIIWGRNKDFDRRRRNIDRRKKYFSATSSLHLLKKRVERSLTARSNFLYSLRRFQNIFVFPGGCSFRLGQTCPSVQTWSSEEKNCRFSLILTGQMCKFGRNRKLRPPVNAKMFWKVLKEQSRSFQGVNSTYCSTLEKHETTKRYQERSVFTGRFAFRAALDYVYF